MNARITQLEDQSAALQRQIQDLETRSFELWAQKFLGEQRPGGKGSVPGVHRSVLTYSVWCTMGSAVSIETSEGGDHLTATDHGQVNPLEIDCNISDTFREHMHNAIADAHASTSRSDLIVMPWETPAMSWVFGNREPWEFPSVPPVLGYIEPSSEVEGTRREPAVIVSDKPTVFEGAISFNSFRTCHLDEGSQLNLLAQRWEALISVNYSAFDIGIDIHALGFSERVRTVAEVLGGKSPATLSRRLSQISKFVGWASNEARRLPFPATAELIKNYVRHLRNNGAGHSSFKGFVEVLKFMKFVVGLDCDLSAFDSAWVSGVIRSAQQARPLRKQSTTLNVKTIQFLESFLCDHNKSLVDRYAVGVFLFAIFSRARFGDLRLIAKIFVDSVEENSDGSLGFLEMHSSSHKMRATGNRLGAHLPLIAPIKGLGPRAWGHDFVEVSKKVGLNLCEWSNPKPLLPAPTQIGDWTDRAVTSTEVCKWMHGVLRQCKDFEPEGFTPHGCKATTLIMLSKYGASPDDRLILGHHQLQRGPLEVYARDMQSAPLRVLERMLGDIRAGRFSPDLTRSGMFTPTVVPPVLPSTPVDSVSPAPTTPLDDTGIAVPDSEEQASFGPAEDVTVAALPTETLTEDVISDGSDSEFDSDESSAEEVIHDLATSQRPTGHWHPGCELFQHHRSKLIHALATFGHRKAFVCGRALSKEYRPLLDYNHVPGLNVRMPP
eukprot:s2110_g11.t3